MDQSREVLLLEQLNRKKLAKIEWPWKPWNICRLWKETNGYVFCKIAKTTWAKRNSSK